MLTIFKDLACIFFIINHDGQQLFGVKSKKNPTKYIFFQRLNEMCSFAHIWPVQPMEFPSQRNPSACAGSSGPFTAAQIFFVHVICLANC